MIKGPRILRVELYDEERVFPVNAEPERRPFTWIKVLGGDRWGFNRDCYGADHLARELGDLAKRYEEMCPNIRQIQVVHNVTRHCETFYAGGYFGRPLIPTETFRFAPLSKKRVKDLRHYVEQLKASGEIPKLLVA